MSYGTMTPYLLHQLVAGPATALIDIPMWYGLFFSDPAVASDPLAVEILGAGYNRPEASWSAYGDTGLVAAADVPFLGLPAGTHAVSIGLFDADINGHLLASDNFDPSEVIDLPTGGSWVMPSGEFFLGFDLTGL